MLYIITFCFKFLSVTKETKIFFEWPMIDYNTGGNRKYDLSTGRGYK